jgi:antimicrobial peptide system SdpB family protein
MPNLPLALARSAIGASTLLSLAFNPTYVLFGTSPQSLPAFNLFYWLSLLGSAGLIFFIYLILTAVVTGILPSLTAIPHWWLCWSILQAGGVPDGGDLINQILALLLIPVCFTHFDFFCHFRSKTVSSGAAAKFSTSCLVIIRVQLAVVYLMAGIEKLSRPEWFDGTATYYLLLNKEYGAIGWVRSFIEPVVISSLGVMICTYGAIAVEILIGTALVWPPRWKRLLFAPAVAFHVVLALCFGVWTLSLSFVGALLIYLLLNNEVASSKESPARELAA